MPQFAHIQRVCYAFALFILTATGKVCAQSCDFVSTNTTGCAPYTVNFVDQSSPGPVSWSWDFGDGNTANTKDPTNLYYSSGIYTVTLEVQFASGAKVTTTKTNYITVHTKPTANFTATNTSGCRNLNVSFTSTSTQGGGKIVDYFYEFGNTFYDTKANTSHSYATAGVYDVRLVVTDTFGCTHSKEIKNLVNVLPTPDADFGSSTNNGCSAPHDVTFINTTVNNATGGVNFWWNFGNSQTSSAKNETIRYVTTGQFDVQLIAQNSLGCKDTMRKTGFVNILSVKANFTNSNPQGCAPLTVNFSNSSTPFNPNNSFYWTFGTGASSNARDTSYQYFGQGTYSVKLVMTAPNGCKDSVTKTNLVQLLSRPDAGFYVNDSFACRAPQGLFFFAKSATATSYYWEFGDGTTSTLRNPAKTYADTGKFTVKLKVSGANGCHDSLTVFKLIKIGPPIAGFEPSIEGGCAPLRVTFSNRTVSYSPLSSILYKFGDGSTSTQGYPTYIYNDTGLFLPKIYVTTDDGCVDSGHYDTIGVGMTPTADFIVDSTVGCRKQLKVKFTSITNQIGPIKADYFEWFPGSGLKLQGENPEMVYTGESRFYDVMLVAYHHGCPDTMKKKDLINVLSPTSKFATLSAGCNADSIFFKNHSIGGTEFHWGFGDGDTAYSDTAGDQAHIYFPGLWTPYLIVHDSNTGCTDTSDNTVLVQSSDVLKFRADTAMCTRDQVWFFDQTPGSSKWLWTVGETRICTTRNCVLTFDQPGYYDVRFSAIVAGCRYTTLKKNYVHIYGPGFVYLTDTVPICAPEIRNVITLVPSERPLANRDLTIIDGSDPLHTIGNFPSFPDTMPYEFDTPLIPQKSGYIFNYWAIDTGGCSNYGADTFPVYRPDVAFTAEREPTCLGDAYLFEASINDFSSPFPYNYRWEFGDGYIHQADSQQARHTYMADSLYPMRLIAFDAKGCSDTVDLPMNIDVRNIKAKFSAPETFKKCPPFLVSFNDESQNTYNEIMEWKWTMGDGKSGFAQNPKKIYTEPGYYDISLKVTDSFGCTDSIFKQAYIGLEGTRVTYSIDTNYGCEPLSIQVNSSALGNAQIRWSMGDGKPIVEQADFVYRYEDAGFFAPIVFVKDNDGCQYVVETEDTIQVAKTPEPNFHAAVTCIGDSTRFVNQTLTFGDTVSYTWFLTPADSLTGENVSWFYPSENPYSVRLKAVTTKKCVVDSTKTIWVSDPKGELSTDKLRECAQQPVVLTLKNTGHGAISAIQWSMKDGNSPVNADSVFTYVYATKGYYRPALIYTNEYGCRDTVALKDSILIGDNFAPVASPIYRTTVDDNHTTSTFIPPSKTIDFEKYIFYRLSPAGVFDSIGEHLLIADTLFTDNVPTLQKNYTYRVVTKNFCGYYSDVMVSPAHRTMELKAHTANDASYLEWTPYAGWVPQAYEIWRASDPGTGMFTKVKEVPGYLTRTHDSAIVCNVGYYYKIKAVGAMSEWYSYSDSSGAVPNYLPYVPGNELLSASIEGPSKNMVQWTFSPGGKAPVKYYILERSRDGLDYDEAGRYDVFSYYAIDPVDSASLRPFFYRTVIEDSCGYRSVESNYGKTVILTAATDSLDQPVLSWTAYGHWLEGVDFYDIEIYRNGGFQYLATVDGNTLQWTDEISELNAAPDYCYRVVARSAEDGGKTSRSSIACAPVRSRIYVPNAFRPGGQLENRTFYPKGMYISVFNMKIYDRWGALVYTTDSMEKGWDGTFHGEPAPGGVYIYKIEYRGVDKDFEELSGSFLLLR